MSASSLTNRPTLKGKWIFFVLAVLAFLSIFLLASNNLFSLHAYLDSFDVDFYSVFDILIDEGIEDFIFYCFTDVPYYILYTCTTAFLLLAFPLVFLMLYILCGYKLRIGSLLLSLSMLTMPVFYTVTAIGNFFEGWQYGENIDLSDLLVLLLLIAADALCAVAALALPLIPKAGKWVAAVAFALGMLSAYAGYFCAYFEPMVEMFEDSCLNSSLLIAFSAPANTMQSAMLLLIVVMLVSKGVPLFQKKAVALTEDTAAIEDVSFTEEDPLDEAFGFDDEAVTTDADITEE